jgi:type VI secretion system ImpC/EvpB family protein
LGAIDLAIADILRAALMDSRFRAFESAWLSLRFLVRRLDFRGGVHLHVYAAPRTEILDALRGTVFPFLDDLRAEGRLACVLMDYSFGDTEKDLADLMEISEVAAEARTPIVTAVDPSILGLRSFGQIHTLPDVSEIFETADRRSWGTLRGKEESRWLFLCMNRFLLRPPYGRDGERVRDFDFEEFPDGTGVAEAAALSLWGRPVWPVGALVADSFARTGWGVEITGPGNAGSIGDLPVRPIELRTGEIVQSPLEVLPSESRVLELSRAGIIALAASRNTDQAFITSAPSFFRPIRSQDKNAYMAEARRATLPYQLFLAQILSWTESIWGHLNPHSSAEDVADTLARGLQFLVLGPAGPIAKVSGEAIGAELGTSRVSLVVEPLGEPLRGLPPIALELPLPRG